MTNILILGSGAREHALSWKLAQSTRIKKVFTIPGNGGIPNSLPDLNPENFEQIKFFCAENEINLIVVGPENILHAGIADYFKDSGIRIFGPSKKASLLECSKIYAKSFMEKYNVATARYRSFELKEGSDTIKDALDFYRALA